jgi:hypothetical protein
MILILTNINIKAEKAKNKKELQVRSKNKCRGKGVSKDYKASKNQLCYQWGKEHTFRSRKGGGRKKCRLKIYFKTEKRDPFGLQPWLAK